MHKLDAKSVFFVRDAERSLRYYTETLGFKLDWNHQESGRAFVFQVSLFGFELIVNQTESFTADRPGHGRVFIGLEPDQVEPLRQHLRQRRVRVAAVHWGAPTLMIRDLDQNELFIWLPNDDRLTQDGTLVDVEMR